MQPLTFFETCLLSHSFPRQLLIVYDGSVETNFVGPYRHLAGLVAIWRKVRTLVSYLRHPTSQKTD